jgi:uncharacterized protein YcbX
MINYWYPQSTMAAGYVSRDTDFSADVQFGVAIVAIIVSAILFSMRREQTRPRGVAHGSLSSVRVYPLKSGAGIDVPCGTADSATGGFIGDRRWMVVDAERGSMLTGRQKPEMLRVQVASSSWQGGAELSLSAPAMEPLTVALGPLTPARGGHRVETDVRVWDDHMQASDCGDEAAEWFTRYLGARCR